MVPVWEDHPVPVCAFYSVRCLGAVEARLKRGSLKAADFLADVSVRWVKEVELQSLDPRGLSFFNLNTPEDYRSRPGNRGGDRELVPSSADNPSFSPIGQAKSGVLP